jgi:hypothetical protein
MSPQESIDNMAGGGFIATGSAAADNSTTGSRRSSFALEQQEREGSITEGECVDLLLDHNPQEADGIVGNSTTTHRHRDSVDDSVRSSSVHLRPGQIERLESRRGLNENQSRIILERRKSFIVEFSQMNGPPQIALLMALLAIGYGSVMGITPAIMSDRFARINHNYDGVKCDTFSSQDIKPNECFLGNADAQAAASISNLISNTLTFCTASLMGSLSDEYGRKRMYLDLLY